LLRLELVLYTLTVASSPPRRHCGPTLAARGFGCAFFKGEPFSLRVGADRVENAEKCTEIIEMGLRGRALFQFHGTPLSDEFLWRHVDWFAPLDVAAPKPNRVKKAGPLPSQG
jgi:hypothetical protein